jgi:superoxide reductase
MKKMDTATLKKNVVSSERRMIMGVSLKGQIYQCKVCGKIVEVLVDGDGTLVCCDAEMTLLAGNSVEASKEKHIPVVEAIAGGFLVKVGSIPHPMEAKHYIQWIELIIGPMTYRKDLKPGDAPEAVFIAEGSEYYARAFCNLHGLWKS